MRILIVPLLCVCFLSLALAGCKKAEEPVSAKKTVIASPPPATLPASPPANGPADSAPAPVPVAASALPSHDVLYKGVQKYMFEHQGRAAKGVDELVAKGYIPALPTPPPGKKYDLDQRFIILKVVDK